MAFTPVAVPQSPALLQAQRLLAQAEAAEAAQQGTFDSNNGVRKVVTLNLPQTHVLTDGAMAMTTTPPPAGLSTGEKVAIGLSVVTAAGIGVYLVTRKKPKKR